MGERTPEVTVTMDVYAVESEVLIDGRHAGIVIAIQISKGCVQYNCVWWDENGRHEETLEDFELKPGDNGKKWRVNQVL